MASHSEPGPPGAPAAAVVLAAGASRRMGQPKALLEVEGRPLICAHVAALVAAGLPRVVVVLGAWAPALRRALRTLPAPAQAALEIAENPAWESTHMIDSVAQALPRIPEEGTVLLTPVDVPPAPPAVVAALVAAGAPACAAHGGQPGHPLLVDRGALEAAVAAGSLRALDPPPRQIATPWPDALRNLNTPAEWRAWRRAADCRKG